MELLAALPAELVAVADPLARAPAPLLRPSETDTDSTAPPLPFELYLTLLTTPLPAGEAWPATGKELPVLPPVAASTAQAESAVALPPADAAFFARLKFASVQAEAYEPPSAGPALPLPNEETPLPVLPTSSTLPRASSEERPQLPLSVAVAAPAASEHVAPEMAEPLTPPVPAESWDSASWLERVAAGDARGPRLQGVTAEPPATLSSPARSAMGAADARLAETAAALRDGPPRLEIVKLSQSSTPAVVEATKGGTDWLPTSFGIATSAPASAAPAPAPAPAVDLRTPNWQEAFASRVQWLVGSHAGEARISLNPPELGAVDVKVSLVDDKTYVQLTTVTAAARDELLQSLPRLRELFAASGLELGGASVHDGRGEHRSGHGGRTAAPDARPAAPFAELADEPTTVVARRTLGRVDLFA